MDAFIDIGTVLGMPVRNMRTYARGFYTLLAVRLAMLLIVGLKKVLS